ncbi:hypothetical protein GWI33_002500 [Rhynchophorus ferrugineus]|uniref:Uncharacterized protein n=1 Tax=Rhynchophorus ferrugineus TaxID=354439 RepID=A0A834IZM9_RHYFE|nr:hypothetical protein GWI33_002500 [Rhynchophorus ferrugineus]
MDYGDVSIIFLKKVLLALLAYCIGYLQTSVLWVILPIVLDIAKEFYLKSRLKRRDLHRRIAANDEKDVIGSLSNLPSWVCFPDMERSEWVNRIIKKLWPNVNNYVHDIIKDIVEAKMNKKLAKYKLDGLVFEKLVVGSVPFRVGGVIAYDDLSRNEIVLDMDIAYAGDCHIILKYGKLKGNIKDFQLYGRLRIIIKPLIDILPLVGGLQIFFLNPPEIDFDLDGVGGLLEFPGFSVLLNKLILDTISSVLVLPNKYPIRFSKKVSKQAIKIPQPEGVLRIHVIQARKLVKRDLTITGQLTSDPYAVLSIGDQECRTQIIERTSNPKWDYWCEFVVEEIKGVFLFISLWDYDTIQEDEPLGKAKVQLTEILSKQNANMWITLECVKHGEIQIRGTWLSFTSNIQDLQQMLTENKQLKALQTLHSAVLTVFVDSITNLAPSKETEKLYTYVQVEVGKQEKTTKTFKKPRDPVWEEGFTFLVPNPEDDYVIFTVFNEKEETVIGTLIYSINELFNEEDYTFEKKSFRLSRCDTDSEINLSMNLRILKNDSFLDTGSQESDGTKPGFSLAEKITGDESLVNDLSEHSTISSSSSTSSDSSDTDSVKSDILSSAKIKLTLRYSVQRQRLIVVVHHIEDLHFDETKSIYVKLYLLPDRHKDNKRKTEVIRTGKDPIFDETFEFFISNDELNRKHLEVSVCEEKMLKNETIEKVNDHRM